jgi:hypothetical protein
MTVEGSPISASNNPWQDPDQPSAAAILDPKSSESQLFEDNFVDAPSGGCKPFQKLDDSEEYIAALERKLRKLTHPKNQEKSLLRALSERRSDEARRFLVSTLRKYIHRHIF